MHLEILPANQQVRDVNEIDTTKVMKGHGVGFSAILKPSPHLLPIAQIPLFQDLINQLPPEKEKIVQVEGWVVEVLPQNKFKVVIPHIKLDVPFLIVDSFQIETHSSFRRSLRRHIAVG